MKRIVFILAVLTLALPLFSATAQDAPVTLRLWVHQEANFNTGTQALIDAYTALHPNVTIDMETFEYDLFIQTLQTALPAGDNADILGLFGSWTCSYADRLAAMPAGLVDTSRFFDAAVGGYLCDDQVYGLPQEFNMEYGTVLVNKAMFEAAGLTYPPAWASLDELNNNAVALAQTGSDGLMTVAGYHFTNADAIAFGFLAGILQNGGDYWNADRSAFTFNTDAARHTLEQMLSLVESGAVDPVLFNDSANWGGNAFFTSQAAITLIGPWAVAFGLSDFPDFGEFGYVALPSFGSSDPLFAADSGWGLAVAGNSPHADIAWDFVQFATAGAENALGWNITSGTIPALREIVETDAARAELLAALPWLEANLPLLQYGRYIGRMPDRDLVFYDILYPYILDTLQGLMSVDEALMFIEEDANATF
ncbi:MAG: extracellular solute-binding protein [Anaerolineae bacterium]|nr:extracellular solute-binding protein [Anaerolineae bacterium]NUQ05405.1 extracellular solute-binding protein [Anaerolineae bacterium]